MELLKNEVQRRGEQVAYDGWALLSLRYAK